MSVLPAFRRRTQRNKDAIQYQYLLLYKIIIVLYNLLMTTLSISELRADISQAINGVKKAPISIARHGEEVAVLISPSQYEKFISAVEELDEILLFDKAMSEKDESVSWEKARKDLGLA